MWRYRAFGPTKAAHPNPTLHASTKSASTVRSPACVSNISQTSRKSMNVRWCLFNRHNMAGLKALPHIRDLCDKAQLDDFNAFFRVNSSGQIARLGIQYVTVPMSLKTPARLTSVANFALTLICIISISETIAGPTLSFRKLPDDHRHSTR